MERLDVEAGEVIMDTRNVAVVLRSGEGKEGRGRRNEKNRT